MIITGCEETRFETGCSFAPAQSKWPRVSCTTCNWSCVDCSVNIEFIGAEYHFDADQIEREPGCDLEDGACRRLREFYSAPFFQSWQVVPKNLTDLEQLIGIKIPLQAFDQFEQRGSGQGASMRLLDYCEDRYDLLEDQDLDESYNVIHSFQKSDSGRYLIDNVPYDWWNVDYQGTLETHFMVNGQRERLKATYQLRMLVEKAV